MAKTKTVKATVMDIKQAVEATVEPIKGSGYLDEEVQLAIQVLRHAATTGLSPHAEKTAEIERLRGIIDRALIHSYRSYFDVKLLRRVVAVLNTVTCKAAEIEEA